MSWSLAGETVDQVSTGPNNVTISRKGIVLELVRQAKGPQHTFQECLLLKLSTNRQPISTPTNMPGQARYAHKGLKQSPTSYEECQRIIMVCMG